MKTKLILVAISSLSLFQAGLAYADNDMGSVLAQVDKNIPGHHENVDQKQEAHAHAGVHPAFGPGPVIPHPEPQHHFGPQPVPTPPEPHHHVGPLPIPTPPVPVPPVPVPPDHHHHPVNPFPVPVPPVPVPPLPPMPIPDHHHHHHDRDAFSIIFYTSAGSIVLGDDDDDGVYFGPYYHRHHVLRWVDMEEGDDMPYGAVSGGEARGQLLYICHANYEGGVHPGKVMNGKCDFTYGGQEITADQYQVLTSQIPLNWEPADNGDIPDGAIAGGYEDDHDLFICQARYHHKMLPGKIVASNCNIGWGGREIPMPYYNALVR